MAKKKKTNTPLLVLQIFIITFLALFGALVIQNRAKTPDEVNGGVFVNRTTKSIMVDGNNRKFVVVTPRKITHSNMPVILALHGGFTSSVSMEVLTSLSQTAALGKAIIIYPEGYEKHWNDGRNIDSFTAFAKQIDDVSFLKRVVDETRKSFPIDTKRVYVTGISNGGMMTLRLACEASETFAGFAVVAANLPLDIDKSCKPQIKRPLVIFNGTKDPIMPWSGGEVRGTFLKQGRVLSTDKTVSKWLSFNVCNSSKKTTNTFDSQNDSTSVEKISYKTCQNNAWVVLYKIINGGHTWPGSIQYLPKSVIGSVTKDINATTEILNFFGI